MPACTILIRTFSQASPSKMSSPKLPLMMSLPPPPMMISAPPEILITELERAPVRVAGGIASSASSCAINASSCACVKPSNLSSPLIKCTFLAFKSLSSTGLPGPAPTPATAPLGTAEPVSVSFLSQPDRPSTESKRSRNVKGNCVAKMGIPKSELAAVESNL